MKFAFLGLAVVFLILIFDIRRHNKIAEEMFPDDKDLPDQKQFEKRHALQINLYAYYVYFIILVALFLKEMFS